MEEAVLDSSVLIGALREEDSFHNRAIGLIEELKKGKRLFHISTLVPIEVYAVILERTKSVTRANTAKEILEEWAREGKINLYTLDERRMNRVTKIVVRDNLELPDAIIAQIAEELRMPLITFDQKLAKRFRGIKL